jgi:glycosyltransferase involved in cell wall biosynthesis
MTSEKIAESQNIISDCTVIVLAKNHEQYLSDCLGSIHRELPGAKILCADVGSGDKSFEKGKEIASILNLNSRHIQLGEDTKTLTALKKLERYIDTKYVVLLSADDALGENYGTALIDILRQTPNYSVINFISMVSDQDLNPLFPKSPKWADKIQKNKRLLSYSNPGTAPGAVIPWEILIKSPSWKQPPNIVIEDYWLWWQLIDQVPFINCKDAYVLYRQHRNNVTKNTKNKDYAYSLGYVSALPNIKAINILNTFLSFFLIPRWIRHLNVSVWKDYAAGYISAIRNEVD